MNHNPIGIFDSGVGGISVLRWIRDELPHEDLIYVADSKNVPYGDKPQEYIEDRSIYLTKFLIDQSAKAIVVACNTATAAAISRLRSIFTLPIIGVEPGVKPALSMTETGTVGILATGETLKSQKFENLTRRFSNSHKLLVQDCPGLVELVEKMDLASQDIRELVKRYVSALLDRGADTIVLGCTHYPFLTPLIKEFAGPKVKIVDTGMAVAKEVARRLKEEQFLSGVNQPGSETFWTTGDLDETKRVIDFLWGKPVEVFLLPDSYKTNK
jgi:glutamate racemase